MSLQQHLPQLESIPLTATLPERTELFRSALSALFNDSKTKAQTRLNEDNNTFLAQFENNEDGSVRTHPSIIPIFSLKQAGNVAFDKQHIYVQLATAELVLESFDFARQSLEPIYHTSVPVRKKSPLL